MANPFEAFEPLEPAAACPKYIHWTTHLLPAAIRLRLIQSNKSNKRMPSTSQGDLDAQRPAQPRSTLVELPRSFFP